MNQKVNHNKKNKKNNSNSNNSLVFGQWPQTKTSGWNPSLFAHELRKQPLFPLRLWIQDNLSRNLKGIPTYQPFKLNKVAKLWSLSFQLFPLFFFLSTETKQLMRMEEYLGKKFGSWISIMSLLC